MIWIPRQTRDDVGVLCEVGSINFSLMYIERQERQCLSLYEYWNEMKINNIKWLFFLLAEAVCSVEWGLGKPLPYPVWLTKGAILFSSFVGTCSWWRLFGYTGLKGWLKATIGVFGITTTIFLIRGQVLIWYAIATNVPPETPRTYIFLIYTNLYQRHL
ncbi:hypothetical protein [Flexibacterium corallicola]|uniref:hypothetical protein n=1 Tax=Flexibacterium corallicola TaxID=3037259 RepID=UPI00286EEB79|nr:hypothetical protein [Pseudovibrio sp. M1P-2-3]